MKTFRRGWGAALLLFILVPVLMFAAAWLIRLTGLSTDISGPTQDGLVVIGAWVYNRYLTHVPIHWWNPRDLDHQFHLAIPSLILVGFLAIAKIAQLFQMAFQPIMLFYIGYVILIGLTEEFVFRGVLIPLLARSMPNHPLAVVIVDSLMFGGLHLINTSQMSWTYVLPQILFAMALGTFFAGLYISTQNLALTIGLHAITDISLVTQLVGHPGNFSNFNMPPTISVIASAFYFLLLIVAIAVVRRQVKGIKIKTEL